MNAQEAYPKLVERSKEISLIANTTYLLSWDQETYMPSKALNFRADQLAYFSGRAHQLFTAPEVGEWLEICEQGGFSSESNEAVNIREWRREYDRATKLPQELVEEREKTTALARNAWVDARKKSDFSIFKPHLEKILEINRKIADLWGYQECRYDALLETYEPGAVSSQIRALFAELKPRIVELLGNATEKSRRIPMDLLVGYYPIEKQKAFNRKVAEAMGFDFEAGRIDTTAHPFCTGLGPMDCRLTARYDEKCFAVSLYGVLHEAGHGLYAQGGDKSAFGTPVGEEVSLGIHESQSRFWENHVGRSLEFWRRWHPVACEHFPELKRFSPEQIYGSVNRVAPSLIRIEADEVTYDLHIILRFELEYRMLEGELKIDDLPAAWNEEFKKMFSITVPNDASGCLQDIHWSLGSMGYFPTYTLGNLNASQLHHAAFAQQPFLADDLRAGRYDRMLGWLRENIHRHGKRYRPQELMQRATGKPTQIADHLEYLKKKI
ncbi:MAG: carboxypeptidase M32 [Verrucomicrobiota bacterium]